MHSGVTRKFGGYGRKYIHRDGESLMVRCLRDGTLDVDLKTGEVWSYRLGSQRKIKTRIDEDGYEKFSLRREAKNGREKRKRDASGRRRLGMEVFVHRLVMVKKIAVAANPDRWRTVVRDLPGSTEVHHRDLNQRNNCGDNLTLELSDVHRVVVHGNETLEPIDF